MLLPTSFGVTLVFTGVQEPPGTEVHGPGPTGVLLREEDHLSGVQPVTGIQLAPLQQDEAAPCRRERGGVPVRAHMQHTHVRAHTCIAQDTVRDAAQISPIRGQYSYQPRPVMSPRARDPQMEAQPPRGPPAALAPLFPAALLHPISIRVGLGDAGTEQLCDGHGMAPSDPATGTGIHPRSRGLLPGLLHLP